MLLNRRALKKHKGNLRQRIGLAIFVIFLSVLAVGCYYFFGRAFLNPIYVSPLSKEALNIASQNDASLGIVERLLHEKNIHYTSVTASDNALTVMLEKDKKVILSQKKDLSLQISSLQFILSRLTMEGREFSSLDLRFDKPTIIWDK